jgi:hypothetical protein
VPARNVHHEAVVQALIKDGWTITHDPLTISYGLEAMEPERKIYLAVPRRVQESVLSERFGQFVIDRLSLRILVFDEEAQSIIQWIE